MIKNILSILVVLTFSSIVGCANKNTASTPSATPNYRWMDRTIYFAYSNNSDPDRNNEFQKADVQNALNDIASSSSLGANYFNFQEVDEGLLQPIVTTTDLTTPFMSFILILPDVDFSDFVVNELGGEVPDPNAVVVLNQADKRQFFMIFKASCFISNSACNSVTVGLGLSAMIARQFGLMTGLSTQNCTSSPDSVMCATLPNDLQWSPSNKLGWIAEFNNTLEAILLNPNFYSQYEIPNN
jgi:hypothetical protein